MGYTTNFQGALKFTKELKASEIAYLSKVLGIDIRDYPDLEGFDSDNGLHYSVDLEFTNDYSGLQWNRQEKSYAMWAQVNFVIKYMQAKFPDFGLVGYMTAQGEDVDDRWVLSVDQNGFAVWNKDSVPKLR